MPNYRLVFPSRSADREAQTIEFKGEDASEALIIAQRHLTPAQLWQDDRHVCTLHRSGNDGEVWIISGDRSSEGAAQAA